MEDGRSEHHPVLVVGAGPGGLTAAHELARLGRPCHVVEADPTYVGGIARTVNHEGYRFDIGGHRFFTKNDEVRALWHEFLPEDDFLTVSRMSRIFYKQRFFDYPLNAMEALRKLGVLESLLCVLSYAAARLRPRREIVSFEDWVTNQFGRRLFTHFFETYTEKVWGMPCSEISSDWASQRIKGLSLVSAVLNGLGLGSRGSGGQVIKTLIEEFEYPRHGPGMMWETLADTLRAQGTPVELGAKVVRIGHRDGAVHEVDVACADGLRTLPVSGLVSSMPMRSLLRAMDPAPPAEVVEAAERLRYRDFLTVALVLDQPDVFPDNWIYVHEPSVQVGRVQNYKNWSPHMVPDPSRTCLGLEYFCHDGDGLWTSSDEELIELGCRELASIGLIDPTTVIDGTVVRMRKCYPVYDAAYASNVAVVRDWFDGAIANLQLCGRNGMHKYNNQDHAMMTALMAARNLVGGTWDQWQVNSDAEYHEDMQAPDVGISDRMVPHPIPDEDVPTIVHIDAPEPVGAATPAAPSTTPPQERAG